MTEEDVFVEESKYGRIPFDYKTILLIHLRNISSLVTNKIIPNSQEPYTPQDMLFYLNQSIDINLESSVTIFEQLLSPYFDKEYLEGIADLQKKKIEDIRTLHSLKLGLLVQLMHRLNLLLEEEGKERI